MEKKFFKMQNFFKLSIRGTQKKVLILANSIFEFCTFPVSNRFIFVLCLVTNKISVVKSSVQYVILLASYLESQTCAPFLLVFWIKLPPLT